MRLVLYRLVADQLDKRYSLADRCRQSHSLRLTEYRHSVRITRECLSANLRTGSKEFSVGNPSTFPLISDSHAHNLDSDGSNCPENR